MKLLIYAILMLSLMEVNGQGVEFHVIGRITTSTDGSTDSGHPSATPLGDPWAVSDRIKEKEARQAEVQRRFDANVVVINNKAQEYQNNGKTLSDALNTSLKVREAQDCLRLKKCFDACNGRFGDMLHPIPWQN